MHPDHAVRPPEATASSTIGIDDVLLARMTSGSVTRRASGRSPASPRRPRWPPRSPGRMRPGPPVRHAASPGPGAPRHRRVRACRARPPCRPSAPRRRPRATSSSVPSTNVTSAPERATTSTMPEPIRPHPTTPTCRTSRGSTVLLPSLSRAQAYNPGHERSSKAGHARGRRGRRAHRTLADVPGRGADRRLARTILHQTGHRTSGWRTTSRWSPPSPRWRHVHRSTHDPTHAGAPWGSRPGRRFQVCAFVVMEVLERVTAGSS